MLLDPPETHPLCCASVWTHERLARLSVKGPTSESADVQATVICCKLLPHQEGRLVVVPLEARPAQAHQQPLAVLAQVSAHAHQQSSIDLSALCNLCPGVSDQAQRLRPHSQMTESAGQIPLCMTCHL